MKKILNIALLLGIITTSANAVMADGMVFDPVDYPAPPKAATTPVKASAIKISTPGAGDVTSKENGNLQNALFQLDSAQVEIRNTLLEYKSKYTDIDNQYKIVKNERKVLGKQVKDIERKIKNLDKTKEKIRKNML